jgi:integrase-like protein
MHRTRYTAGQRVLDATGNLKAVQALLGHASISTTADTYTNWDVQQLESSLLQTFSPQRTTENNAYYSFLPSQDVSPANRTFMEAAGIEPASAVAPSRASTSVVRA